MGGLVAEGPFVAVGGLGRGVRGRELGKREKGRGSGEGYSISLKIPMPKIVTASA